MPKPDNTMTVAEFVEARKNDLDEFLAFWKRESKAQPDNFPKRMTLAEWFEQEESYLETKDE